MVWALGDSEWCRGWHLLNGVGWNQYKMNCMDRIELSQNFSKCLKMSQNVSKCLKSSQNVSKCLKISQDTKTHIRWYGWIFSKFLKMSQTITGMCVWLRSKTDHCGGIPEIERQGGENKLFKLYVSIVNCLCYSHLLYDAFIVNSLSIVNCSCDLYLYHLPLSLNFKSLVPVVDSCVG